MSKSQKKIATIFIFNFISGLEKRPTFDNIDKRASWSIDKGHYLPPHQSKHRFHNEAKKPVPLPRSKIPVPSPTKAATIERSAAVQNDMRTFKRSKTDLSLNMLTNYKNNKNPFRSTSNNPTNFPKVSSNPSPTKQPKSAQVRSRPSNRINRPAVISEEKSLNANDSKQTESLVINENHLFNKFKMNKVSNNNKMKVETDKPVIREKPIMTSGVRNLSSSKISANIFDKKTNAALLSRHRSESDLLRIEPSLNQQQSVKTDNNLKKANLTDNDTSIINDQMRISLKVELDTSEDRVCDSSESKESSSTLDNAQASENSSSKKVKNKKVTNDKFLDSEDTLPDPPPTPPCEETEVQCCNKDSLKALPILIELCKISCAHLV